MVWGWREPLHIILLYPAFMYPVHVAVVRMNLPEYCMPFAAGLLDCIMDIPFDIIGIKFVWWTWHDTDSNIYERSYWVPWCSYIFHMTFATAVTFLMINTRRYFTGISGTYSDDEIEAMPYTRKILATKQFWGEFKAMCVTGLLGMPTGILIFLPFYHWPHDIFHVSSEVCTWAYASLCLIMTCYGLSKRTPVDMKESGEREIHRGHKKRGKGYWHVDEVFLICLVHYSFYFLVVTFADPSIIRSVGVRQEVGTMTHPTFNCNKTTALTYPYGLSQWTPFLADRYEAYESPKDAFKSKILPNGDLKIWKNPYLCIESDKDELKFEEPYFDFDCLEKLPDAGEWFYTVCGNAYGSHNEPGFGEYWFVVTCSCIFGLGIFTQAFCYPRVFYEVWWTMMTGGGLPMCYKSIVEYKETGLLDEVREHRSSVTEEYLVVRQGGEAVWESKYAIETDGCGEVYGEGGGLYGHAGTGGSRARVHRFRSSLHAETRLQADWPAVDKLRRERNLMGTRSGDVPQAKPATRRTKKKAT